MIYHLKQFIRRFFILINTCLNPKLEPFGSIKIAWKHFLNANYYPNKVYKDFVAEINIEERDDFKYAIYDGVEVAYEKKFSDLRIKQMLNAVLNEQSPERIYRSPHLYLVNDEILTDDVIYDLGAAEGYQSKLWAKTAKNIVIFEPSPSYYKCLLETFKSEISEGKVLVVNEGISNKEMVTTGLGESFMLDSLDNLIRKHNLPKPTYVKVDIEGHEMAFLEGAVNTLSQGSLRLLEITTYHYPNDYLDIPKFLSQFEGEGNFTEDVVAFNRKSYAYPGLFKPFHPVFRKCLYSYYFMK